MSEYAFSLTTFSPNGKLVQIEHALNAVNNHGRPALGIKARNGVVIATEKKVGSSILVDTDSVSKVEIITNQIGCVFSGMPADFRVILNKARKEAQTYWRTYYTDIPVHQLVCKIAAVVQEYTQSGGVRPFGVSLLVCGFDEHMRMQLYQVDPSGAYFAWKATAIGKDNNTAKAFLEKRYSEDMEIEDAIHTALLTLKENFDGIMNETNVQLGIVTESGCFKALTPVETKDYLSEIE